MHGVLEGIKALPGRLRRLAFRLRRVDRWRNHLHGRDIARAIGKDGAGLDPHDELCADGLAKQRIAVAHPRAAVDAQPLRFVGHGDEQEPDIRIDQQVAQALEHAVAVIVGKSQLAGSRHPHETRHAGLERAIRPALRVGSGDEEKGGALDEGLVVVGERGARQLFFQPVGDPPALEAILQVPVAVMVHDAHVCPLKPGIHRPQEFTVPKFTVPLARSQNRSCAVRRR